MTQSIRLSNLSENVEKESLEIKWDHDDSKKESMSFFQNGSSKIPQGIIPYRLIERGRTEVTGLWDQTEIHYGDKYMRGDGSEYIEPTITTKKSRPQYPTAPFTCTILVPRENSLHGAIE